MSRKGADNQQIIQGNGGMSMESKHWVRASVSRDAMNHREQLTQNKKKMREKKSEQQEKQRLVSIPNLAFPQKDATKISQMLKKKYEVSEKELIEGFGAAGQCVLVTRYYEGDPRNKDLIPKFLNAYSDFLGSINISPFVSRVLAALKKPTEKVDEEEILTTKMQIINKLFISQFPSFPAFLTSDNDQLKQEYTAVVLDSLRKIDQILEFSPELICEAVKKFVEKNDELTKEVEKKLEKNLDQTLEKFMKSDESDDTKITKILSLITEEQTDPKYLTQLVPFMCEKLGIKDPEEIEDESNEPHGFFAKMIHIVCNPIEFFKVKILGKKKTSELDGGHDEMRGNGSAKDFAEEQASYFTYVKDTVFSIINLSWLFSSTGGGENKKETDPMTKHSELDVLSPTEHCAIIREEAGRPGVFRWPDECLRNAQYRLEQSTDIEPYYPRAEGAKEYPIRQIEGKDSYLWPDGTTRDYEGFVLLWPDGAPGAEPYYVTTSNGKCIKYINRKMMTGNADMGTGDTNLSVQDPWDSFISLDDFDNSLDITDNPLDITDNPLDIIVV